MSEKFYMTTAIAYASKKPHFGNTYEAIMTDAMARFRRSDGRDGSGMPLIHVRVDIFSHLFQLVHGQAPRPTMEARHGQPCADGAYCGKSRKDC